jgi:hypothetical protein
MYLNSSKVCLLAGELDGEKKRQEWLMREEQDLNLRVFQDEEHITGGQECVWHSSLPLCPKYNPPHKPTHKTSWPGSIREWGMEREWGLRASQVQH